MTKPTKSDQSLRCPHEESLGPKLPTERTAKTLIRLDRCPGLSESSLGAQPHFVMLWLKCVMEVYQNFKLAIKLCYGA